MYPIEQHLSLNLISLIYKNALCNEEISKLQDYLYILFTDRNNDFCKAKIESPDFTNMILYKIDVIKNIKYKGINYKFDSISPTIYCVKLQSDSEQYKYNIVSKLNMKKTKKSYIRMNLFIPIQTNYDDIQLVTKSSIDLYYIKPGSIYMFEDDISIVNIRSSGIRYQIYCSLLYSEI